MIIWRFHLRLTQKNVNVYDHYQWWSLFFYKFFSRWFDHRECKMFFKKSRNFYSILAVELKMFFFVFLLLLLFWWIHTFFLLKGNRVSIEKRKKTFLTGNRQYHIIIRILLPVKWNEWKGFFSVHYSVFLLWKNFKLFVVVEFKSRPW